MKKQLNDPESPLVIAKMNEGAIFQGLKNLREAEIMADIIENYPLVYQDHEDWYTNRV